MRICASAFCCARSRLFEGDGLQPVSKYFAICAASAAEACFSDKKSLYSQPLTAPNLGHSPHMGRPGAATSADPLRAICPPPSRQFAKLLYLSVTLPAVMHGIPLLTGVGIDDDRFARDLSRFAE